MTSPSLDTTFGNSISNYKIATISGTSTTLSMSTATAGADEVIVAIVAYEIGSGTTPSISSITESSHTLTFTHLVSFNNPTSGAHDQTIEIWTAKAAAIFNSGAASITYTFNWSGGTVDNTAIVLFAVKNVGSINSPLDPNGTLPASAYNTTVVGAPAVTFSTTNPDDLLIGVSARCANGVGLTEPSGWSTIANQDITAGVNWTSAAAYYKSVSSTQSSTTFQDANPTTDISWLEGVVAFTADVSNSGSWASTETADAMDFVGSLGGPPTGSWHSTEADDTLAASGFPELPNGSWFVTEPTDTASIHGYTGTPPVITNYVTGGAADSGGSGITSANVTLSTPVAGELIVVQVTTGGYFHHGFPAESPVPISDTAGLTWHLRSSFTPPADPDFDEPSQINCQVWWAEAPAALTSDVITVETASATGFIAITAIAIVGGVGFDGNADLPDEVDNGGSGEPNVTVSTSGTTRS